MILKEHFVTACFVQYPESAVTISVTLGMQDFFDVAVSEVQQTVFIFLRGCAVPSGSRLYPDGRCRCGYTTVHC